MEIENQEEVLIIEMSTINIVMGSQSLYHQTILDSGAASHGRYSRQAFTEGDLSERRNVVITGVGGRLAGHPMMGSVRENNEILKNVILLDHIDYNIDSDHQRLFVEGYEEDKNTDKRHKRYVKVDAHGNEKVLLYEKPEGGTHFIRINAMNSHEKLIAKTLKKMQPIHCKMGHLHARKMLELCDVMSAEELGYTKVEARMYLKYGKCYPCIEGQMTARNKDSKGKLIYVEYQWYNDREGIHIDVFFVGDKWAFFIARSTKHKMLWVFDVGKKYKAANIRACIESILGDYKYTGIAISFVRSDGDTRFQPMMEWLQQLGIRYYMSPPGLHATKIESIIRVVKNLCRTLIRTLEFLMPDKYVPYLIREAIRLLTVRYDKDLRKTPRESFFNETTNYKHQFSFQFGEVISYHDVITDSSVFISRLNYGVVLGVEVLSGNLIVENFATKRIDPVANFKEKIPVDDAIRTFYKNYNNVTGLRYSKNHSIYVSAENAELVLNPSDPEGLWRERILGVKNQNSELEVLSSKEYYDMCRLITESHINSATKVERVGSSCQEEIPETLSSNADDDVEHCQGSPISSRVVDVCEILTMNAMQELGINIESTDFADVDGYDSNRTPNPIEINELNIIDPHTNYNLIQSVIQMNYNRMYKLHPELTHDAGLLEYKTISERNTITGVLLDSIPSDVKIGYIMSRFTEKYKAGQFDRVKGRLLYGGNELKDEYTIRWDEISARTISSSSLFTIIALMAYLKMKVGTMDFKSAFLYALLPQKDQCYAKLSKEDSKLLIEADPEKWTPYLNADGHIYVKVVGALYGHPMAPVLWYNYLKEKLAIIGFVPLFAEMCIFIRRYEDGTFDIIGIHVDDLIMGSLKEGFFDEMQNFLNVYFRGEGTMDIGKILEYLNMTLTFNDDDSVTITQEHYWAKVCARFGLGEEDVAKCPHKTNFMKRLRERGQNDDQIKDDNEDTNKFLSIIMSILWGAKRSKPDILFNTTVLATRSKFGTQEDIEDAMQVLKYINGTKSEGIRLKINGKVRLSVFVDSSCNIHPDTKGHGGYVISIGDKGYGGPIETSASRAKLNGRCSMDYELYEFHHMLPGALYLRELLEEIGFPQDPILIFEDNKSLIDVLKRGKISTGVTRHIAAKYYYGKDLLLRKIIELRHCPTLLMISDIFTKDLPGYQFTKLSPRLRNSIIQDESLNDEVYERLYANSSDSVYLDDDERKAVEIISIIIERILQS